MNILFIGDVFGNAGKWVLSECLKRIRETHNVDLCIANGENVAGGRGITRNLFTKLKRMGVDVVTGGNHVWENPDIIPLLDSEPTILRPLNYPENSPGHGSCIVTTPDGIDVGVINLQGRTFMPPINCPFEAGMREVERLKSTTPVLVVDLHAEATSEKMALGWYLDGKVSAVIGTHTHVPSADECVLPGGTAYITDAGMTGPRESVIGMKKQQVIQKFLLHTYVRFEPANGDPWFSGVLMNVDEQTGRARGIERLYFPVQASA